jgi:hypothetical protein
MPAPHPPEFRRRAVELAREVDEDGVRSIRSPRPRSRRNCGHLGNPFKKCKKGRTGDPGFLGGVFSEGARLGGNAFNRFARCLGLDCVSTAAWIGAAFYIGIGGGRDPYRRGVVLCTSVAGCVAGLPLAAMGVVIATVSANNAYKTLRKDPGRFSPGRYEYR